MSKKKRSKEGWVRRLLGGGRSRVVERDIGLDRMYQQANYLVQHMNGGQENYDAPYYLVEIVQSTAGELYALINSKGALYRAFIEVGADDTVTLGELQVVTAQYTPPLTKIRTWRGDDGHGYIEAISSAAVLNRCSPPEIDSSNLFQALQDGFVKRIESGEFEKIGYPRRNLLHDQSLTIGDVVLVERDGYLLLTMTRMDKTPLAEAQYEAITNNPDAYGDSIEYLPAEDGMKWTNVKTQDGMELQFRTFNAGEFVGVASLPEENAASLFTRAFVVNKRSNNDMNKEKYIAKLAADSGRSEDMLLASVREIADKANQEIERGIADGTTIARAGDDKPDGEKDETKRGTELSEMLKSAIAKKVSDDMTEADIISEMATAAGIEPGTVNQILKGGIDKPTAKRLEAFASVLDISADALKGAAGYSDDDKEMDRSADDIEDTVVDELKQHIRFVLEEDGAVELFDELIKERTSKRVDAAVATFRTEIEVFRAEVETLTAEVERLNGKLAQRETKLGAIMELNKRMTAQRFREAAPDSAATMQRHIAEAETEAKKSEPVTPKNAGGKTGAQKVFEMNERRKSWDFK